MRTSMILPVLAFFLLGILAYPVSASTKSSPHIPAKIKILMGKAQLLDDRCRAPGADPNGHVCDLRYDAYEHLRHLGWCWDSEKTDAIEADYHWIRCSLVQTIP